MAQYRDSILKSIEKKLNSSDLNDYDLLMAASIYFNEQVQMYIGNLISFLLFDIQKSYNFTLYVQFFIWSKIFPIINYYTVQLIQRLYSTKQGFPQGMGKQIVLCGILEANWVEKVIQLCGELFGIV